MRPETPAKSVQEARFALTLVEQLPACAETLRVWLADANRGPSVAPRAPEVGMPSLDDRRPRHL